MIRWLGGFGEGSESSGSTRVKEGKQAAGGIQVVATGDGEDEGRRGGLVMGAIRDKTLG
jgi:hypothetical protein